MFKISQNPNQIDLPRLYSQTRSLTVSQIAITIVALAAIAVTAKLFYTYARKHLDKKKFLVILLSLLAITEIVRRNLSSIRNNRFMTGCRAYVSSDRGPKKDLTKLLKFTQSKISKAFGTKNSTKSNVDIKLQAHRLPFITSKV